MKTVAILQSNYIPWKGYFDLINSVDEFILFDDVQFTKRDWRNRNLIKTPSGLFWLTIPVEVKGKYHQKIYETVIADRNWGKKHWSTICYNYERAKYFKEYKDYFENLYLNAYEQYIHEINRKFIMAINTILGIETKVTASKDYNIVEGKTERLVDLCIQSNASEYISGPSARCYIDEEIFRTNGIKVAWMNYSGYAEYDQLYPPFVHGVTVLDLIFNMGSNARNYMNSFSKKVNK